VRARLRERNQLVLEILALRHQIVVLRRTGTRRSRLSVSDRLFWVFLSRWWSGWRSSLTIVRAETVLGWRRQGWSLLWRFGRGRRWRGGRPRIASEIRDLIIRMARENFLWGAPRIHGELLKLGYDVSQATVSRYLPGPGGRSLTWRTFLHNQALGIGLAKPFATREAADRLVLLLRTRVECPARYACESLTEVGRLLTETLPGMQLQAGLVPGLDQGCESTGLNSAVAVRRRYGLRPNLIARRSLAYELPRFVRGPRVWRDAASNNSVHPAARRELRESLHIARADQFASFAGDWSNNR
jgi:hypothetical protein